MQPSDDADHRPLAGVLVLDVTTALAGPYATQILAGMGATVVKVEAPTRPDDARSNAPYIGRDGITLSRAHADDLSLSLLDRNRDKLGLALDLKVPSGRAIFDELVDIADVLVTNFAPDALVRLGVDHATLLARNPRIVYAAITGFGLDSPPGRGKAMDTMIQAMGGLMLASGAPGDGPTRIGVPIADLTAPLYAVIGILGALRRAEATGHGDVIDVSMLGSVTSLVATESWGALEQLGLPTRTGNVLPRLTPFGIFPTGDGEHVAICAPTDALSARLFTAMGIEDPSADPMLDTRDHRVVNADAVVARIEAWTRSRPRSEVLDELSAHDVPCTAVRSPAEAVVDPLLLERGETTPIRHPLYGEVDGVVGTGLPIRSAASGIGYRRAAPAHGEHTRRLLTDLLGMPGSRIDELVADGVLAEAAPVGSGSADVHATARGEA